MHQDVMSAKQCRHVGHGALPSRKSTEIGQKRTVILNARHLEVEKLMNQILLSRMGNLLDSNGTNYTTFLESYSVTPAEGDKVQDIVTAMVGQRVAITDLRHCSLAEVTETLRDCLGYIGEDEGPDPDTLASPEFSSLLQGIIEDVAQAIKHSNVVQSFRFLDGHPAYPVFWEFAFLFLGKDSHQLLVGSSSD